MLAGHEVATSFSRDTGIGTPQTGLERLFQPFAQADTSVARRFGGTGLGLSIGKSLVEMMGARIWVESEVGKGSTVHFTVRLPEAEEAVNTIQRECGALTAALREYLRRAKAKPSD